MPPVIAAPKPDKAASPKRTVSLEVLFGEEHTKAARGKRGPVPPVNAGQDPTLFAGVLGSPRAIAVNIEIMRTFVRVRALAATHGDLAKQLAELEDKTEALAMNHDTFSRNTRNQLKQVFDALRELMTPPDPPKRPIGFIAPEDKGKKTSSQAKHKT